MILKYLLEKEFKQLLRNAFLPRLILIFPCMIMLLMPWAMTLEIKNVSLCVVDNDHTISSRRLIDKITASDYFKLVSTPSSYQQAMEEVDKGNVNIIMEIPANFESDYVNGSTPQILIAANAVDGMKGNIGSSYLSSIVSNFASEIKVSQTVTPTIGIKESALNLFNPNLNYKVFMIPALMAMLLTLLCGFLPTLNIVGEKEIGTIEQINVSPVNKFTFILGKLLPYWLIGFIVLSICFLIAWLFYDITPVGNLGVIYLFSLIFVVAMSGMGLVISNNSSTIQQAMFVMWFFMLLLILMSGLFTPISSMPKWAQLITYCNPLRYQMQMMRMVYLKGSGFFDLLPQLFALLAFAFVFNSWAVISYRKQN